MRVSSNCVCVASITRSTFAVLAPTHASRWSHSNRASYRYVIPSSRSANLVKRSKSQQIKAASPAAAQRSDCLCLDGTMSSKGPGHFTANVEKKPMLRQLKCGRRNPGSRPVPSRLCAVRYETQKSTVLVAVGSSVGGPQGSGSHVDAQRHKAHPPVRP